MNIKNALVLLSLVIPVFANAETFEAVPDSLASILNGTGVGTCDIVFPDNTINSFTNKSRVNFDPNGILGEEVYSMALAAVSAGNKL